MSIAILRFGFCTSIAALTLHARDAVACSILAPPVEEVATDVAMHGTLISGEVIQAYDASKQQPPIIRAKIVFIGDGEARDFVIYVPPMPEGAIPISCDRPYPWRVGEIFDRLVLEPAPSKADAAANGRWRLHLFGGSMTYGKGLKLLVAKAADTGRLKTPPPYHPRYDGD